MHEIICYSDYRISTNFVMSHTQDTAMQTSPFLNLVSLEKLTVGKNTLDNSNADQHAKVAKNVLVSAYQCLGLGLGPQHLVHIPGGYDATLGPAAGPVLRSWCRHWLYAIYAASPVD